MMSVKTETSSKLVIVRHGESEWNALGLWTGTRDVHLTAKGEEEARAMGVLLSDVAFDQVYTSEQIRTQETAHQLLVAAGQPAQFQITGALNERDYGIHTGKNKWEVKEQIGEAAFDAIRRNWNEPVPGGETLKQVYERAVPFYESELVPLLNNGKNVLIVAHGNSIRSLVKYIESINDAEIANVEMIFGTALIYSVDSHGKMRDKEMRQIQTELPPA